MGAASSRNVKVHTMHKRVLEYSLLFVIATALALTGPAHTETTVAGSYDGGTGASGTPYKIATLAQLRLLSETSADWAAGTYFILTADIDAADTSTWNSELGFSPIGNPTTPFSGELDGQGFIITDLVINRPLENDIGFIGETGSQVVISNLGLENLSLIHI